jgi:copper(I)-binding protein
MLPGSGFHLMLLGLKQPLRPGEQFPLLLKFRQAGAVKVTVTVQQPERAGTLEKKASSHAHH